MNDAMYYAKKERERLEKENNAILEGYIIKARYSSMLG